MNKALGLLLALSTLLPASDEKSRQLTAQRLEESAVVLTEVVSAGNQAIPKTLLQEAYCIAIIFAGKEDSSVVSRGYGRGFISCRSRGGNSWSAPGAVRLDGASFEADVVVLVMSQLAANRLLLSGQSTLPREGVALRSWSRVRGVFSESAFEGSALHEDVDGNEALYGKRLHSGDIVLKGLASTPPPARKLLSILSDIGSTHQHPTCDLNGDGVVNNFDVQIEQDQVLGIAPCTNGDLNGDGLCNAIDLQRVIYAALGHNCRIGP